MASQPTLETANFITTDAQIMKWIQSLIIDISNLPTSGGILKIALTTKFPNVAVPLPWTWSEFQVPADIRLDGLGLPH